MNTIQIAQVRSELKLSGEPVTAIRRTRDIEPLPKQRDISIGQQNATREVRIKNIIHEDMSDKSVKPVATRKTKDPGESCDGPQKGLLRSVLNTSSLLAV